jgi:hypothetical protein
MAPDARGSSDTHKRTKVERRAARTRTASTRLGGTSWRRFCSAAATIGAAPLAVIATAIENGS